MGNNKSERNPLNTFRATFFLAALLVFVCFSPFRVQAKVTNEDCLACHSDKDLQAQLDGRLAWRGKRWHASQSFRSRRAFSAIFRPGSRRSASS